ncbi:MAG TPA: hypothetical protein VMR29_03580 [Candidatus Binatia bacterium]|nr:hypothetical protein [Candidatus Binatia bacterium]
MIGTRQAAQPRRIDRCRRGITSIAKPNAMPTSIVLIARLYLIGSASNDDFVDGGAFGLESSDLRLASLDGVFAVAAVLRRGEVATSEDDRARQLVVTLSRVVLGKHRGR